MLWSVGIKLLCEALSQFAETSSIPNVMNADLIFVLGCFVFCHGLNEERTKHSTECDVADVVSGSRVCVCQFQRRLSVAEQHLRRLLVPPPAFFEFLAKKKKKKIIFVLVLSCLIRCEQPDTAPQLSYMEKMGPKNINISR